MVWFIKYNDTWEKRINTGCRLKSWHGFIKSKSLGTHGFSSWIFLIRLSKVSLYSHSSKIYLCLSFVYPRNSLYYQTDTNTMALRLSCSPRNWLTHQSKIYLCLSFVYPRNSLYYQIDTNTIALCLSCSSRKWLTHSSNIFWSPRFIDDIETRFNSMETQL